MRVTNPHEIPDKLSKEVFEVSHCLRHQSPVLVGKLLGGHHIVEKMDHFHQKDKSNHEKELGRMNRKYLITNSCQ